MLTPELKKVILQKYRAPDGGATPHAGYFIPPFKKHFPLTVSHGNHPLFATMLYDMFMLDGSFNGQDEGFIARTLQLLQVHQNKDTGLYYRAPGHDTEYLSHDNQMAIVWMMVTTRSWARLQTMLDHGAKNGWSFNPLGGSWRAASVRRPAEVTICKLCNGDTPGIFALVHLCLKVWYTATFQLKKIKDGIKISEANLTWVRYRALSDAYEHLEPKLTKKGSMWMYRVAMWFFGYWRKRLGKQGGIKIVWKQFWGKNKEQDGAPEVVALIEGLYV